MFLLQEVINAKEIESIELPSALETEEIGEAEAAIATASSKESVTTLKDLDSDEELDLLSDMIQTSQFHHPHHRAFQVCKMRHIYTMLYIIDWNVS